MDAVDKRPQRVLAVEADTANLDLIALVLRRLPGCELQRVTSLQAARALLATAHPDLLLINADLPDGGALTLCREVRQQRAGGRLPILLLVRPQDRRGMLEGLAAGATDVLRKPVYPTVLAARVATYLRLALAPDATTTPGPVALPGGDDAEPPGPATAVPFAREMLAKDLTTPA
ncbi:MAG: response regulator [Verrucomicrobiota bacterium]